MTNEGYHFTECGLDYVWLKGGVTIENGPYGETVSIEQADRLLDAIARVLCENVSCIGPDEFKFLRKRLDFSQNALARELETKEQNVHRWETGKTPVPGTAKSAISLLYSYYNRPENAHERRVMAALDRRCTELKVDCNFEGDSWNAKAA